MAVRPHSRTFSLTRVQTLGHGSRVDEVPAAQTAGDVGVYVPEFNLSGQHLWLLQEKNAHELISETFQCISPKIQASGEKSERPSRSQRRAEGEAAPHLARARPLPS